MMKSVIVGSLISILGCGALAWGESMDVESGFIDVAGGKIFYERAGQGEPIILIHDGLVHRELWENQFGFFARGHTVVRYDRRGYGLSPMPDEPYSNIEDLNAIFTTLKIERATLIGVSAGGGLAIDFTLKYPDKVTALVLVGAVVSGMGYTDHMMTRGGRLTAANYADRGFMDDYWLNKDPYEMAPANTAARERMKQLVLANPGDLDDTKERFVKGPDRPALPNLKEIAVPTIIVVGEFDIPDVHAHAGAIAAGIPGAQRVIVPNAGHLVPLEVPDVFNQQVGFLLTQYGFLRTLDAQGVAVAVKAFEDARAKDPGVVLFSEGRMNQLGYERLGAGRLDEAIEIFKLNVTAYPKSWNVYDSLGEAYATKGERDLAKRNYEKSLELNPENQYGKRALERLKG